MTSKKEVLITQRKADDREIQIPEFLSQPKPKKEIPLPNLKYINIKDKRKEHWTALEKIDDVIDIIIKSNIEPTDISIQLYFDI